MRTPLKDADYFGKQVNAAFDEVQKAYLETIGPAIEMHKASAMLGDGTVAQPNTFDPQNVQMFYQRLTNGLKGWLSAGVSKSETEDLHRLYCQFAKEVGKFQINAYFGIQFHALPYYRVDKRVIEVQKELAQIAENATSVFQAMTGEADKALKSELEKRGYASMEFEELFTKMFNDEDLARELDKKAAAVEGQFPAFGEMGDRKNKLFAELNDLLIELYQTSPVPVDYNRLMQGEEGVTVYFDIEQIKNKKTKKMEASFETAKVAKEDADLIAAELVKVAKALKKAK